MCLKTNQTNDEVFVSDCCPGKWLCFKTLFTRIEFSKGNSSCIACRRLERIGPIPEISQGIGLGHRKTRGHIDQKKSLSWRIVDTSRHSHDILPVSYTHLTLQTS